MADPERDRFNLLLTDVTIPDDLVGPSLLDYVVDSDRGTAKQMEIFEGARKKLAPYETYVRNAATRFRRGQQLPEGTEIVLNGAVFKVRVGSRIVEARLLFPLKDRKREHHTKLSVGENSFEFNSDGNITGIEVGTEALQGVQARMLQEQLQALGRYYLGIKSMEFSFAQPREMGIDITSRPSWLLRRAFPETTNFTVGPEGSIPGNKHEFPELVATAAHLVMPLPR